MCVCTCMLFDNYIFNVMPQFFPLNSSFTWPNYSDIYNLAFCNNCVSSFCLLNGFSFLIIILLIPLVLHLLQHRQLSIHMVQQLALHILSMSFRTTFLYIWFQVMLWNIYLRISLIFPYLRKICHGHTSIFPFSYD